MVCLDISSERLNVESKDESKPRKKEKTEKTEKTEKLVKVEKPVKDVATKQETEKVASKLNVSVGCSNVPANGGKFLPHLLLILLHLLLHLLYKSCSWKVEEQVEE